MSGSSRYASVAVPWQAPPAQRLPLFRHPRAALSFPNSCIGTPTSTILVPKSCLGTPFSKLCFESGPCAKQDFADMRSQTEFGNEVFRTIACHCLHSL